MKFNFFQKRKIKKRIHELRKEIVHDYVMYDTKVPIELRIRYFDYCELARRHNIKFTQEKVYEANI